MRKGLSIGVLIAVSAVLLVGFFFYSYYGPGAVKRVNDFDSCAAAPGSVIMESYPEQCRTTDGRTFVNEKQQAEIEKSYITDCKSAGGSWLPKYDECEGVSESWCTSAGGSFNECESACRHDAPGTPCILLCVPVCAF